MRRLHWCALAVVIPSLTLVALSSGCNGTKTKKTGGGSTSPDEEVALEPLPTMARGTLKGKVTLAGSKPNLDELTANLRKQIDKHANKDTCLAGSRGETSQQDWKIDDNGGGVGDVIVWLQPPEGKYFQLTAEDLKLKEVPPPKSGEDYVVDIKAQEVVLDQPHCAFIPHVFALFPSYFDGKERKETGQKMTIKNSAPMPHNTKREGTKNPAVDRTLPPGKSETIPPLKPVDTVTFQCNLHPWMRAYARVMDHPFVAVTKKDGTFEIPNAPADVELRVVAWHQPGDNYLTGAEGEKITIKKEGTTKDFTIKPK